MESGVVGRQQEVAVITISSSEPNLTITHDPSASTSHTHRARPTSCLHEEVILCNGYDIISAGLFKNGSQEKEVLKVFLHR